MALADSAGFKYVIDHRMIELSIDEDKIPPFLDALSKASVSYANIKIEEPSLEDFFLQMVKKPI